MRLRVIGDRTRFDEKLQTTIAEAEELTRLNRGLTLNIAANYGGHWDICAAARQVAEKVAAGELSSQEITPEVMASHMSLSDLPDPDLLIRTGGEKRLSNFLLWQLAYSELYFSDLYWPDFNEVAFQAALDWFSTRQRRFGGLATDGDSPVRDKEVKHYA